MDEIILIAIIAYLAIGIVLALVGFVIMNKDETDFMLSLNLFQYLRGFFKSIIAWPFIVMGIINMRKHRKEWEDEVDRLEDYLRKGKK